MWEPSLFISKRWQELLRRSQSLRMGWWPVGSGRTPKQSGVRYLISSLIRPDSILVTYASVGFFTDELVLKCRARWQSNSNRPCRVVCGGQRNLRAVNRVSGRSSSRNQSTTILTAEPVSQLPNCDRLPTRKMFLQFKGQY